MIILLTIIYSIFYLLTGYIVVKLSVPKEVYRIPLITECKYPKARVILAKGFLTFTWVIAIPISVIYFAIQPKEEEG